jgi:hypothetical protein
MVLCCFLKTKKFRGKKLSRKNRDLSASNHDIPDVGALVTVKIYAAGGAPVITKGFVLKKIPDRQTSLFSSVSIYLLANHTTEIVFANQIIEVLSAPA